MNRAALWGVIICASQHASAQTLNLPAAATATLQPNATTDTLAIATGGWNGALPQTVVSGTLTRGAWALVDTAQTPLAVLEPLRAQLLAQGYTEIYSCPDLLCGGFDFRFALDLLPPPAMQVNLADYQYWAGENGDAYAVILTSRIDDTVYLQIDRIGDTAAPAPRQNQTQTGATRTVPSGATATLETDGRMVLSDLTFAPGSATLDAGSYPSLATLAVYLSDNPELRVALVGHTDTSGTLAGNIALSKRRAQSVVDRLIDAYDVPRAQITAEGMGYLAPLATNLTATGREANRRVEVIIVSREE